MANYIDEAIADTKAFLAAMRPKFEAINQSRNFSAKTKNFQNIIRDLFGDQADLDPELIAGLAEVEWAEDKFLKDAEQSAICINQFMLDFMNGKESFPLERVITLLSAAKDCYEAARQYSRAFDNILLENKTQDLKNLAVKMSFTTRKPTLKG